MFHFTQALYVYKKMSRFPGEMPKLELELKKSALETSMNDMNNKTIKKQTPA